MKEITVNKRKYTARLLGCIVLFGLLLSLLTACGSGGEQETQTATATRSAFYFDTVIDLEITGENAEELAGGCIRICQEMEDTLSAQKEGSELYELNHRSEQSVEVSDDLAACIESGLGYSAMSDGLFDITILPVRDLWDFTGEDPQVPSDGDLKAAVKKVDYRKVHVSGNTVTFDSPDTQIDLGGIAKGYISMKLRTYLRENGCTNALINLGGNVSAIGENPSGRPWKIGIQTPFAARGTVLEALENTDTCNVTSGTYERYFEKDGVRYHHLLDPFTGYPADTGLNQVTVVTDNDVEADALSSICLLMGREKAEEFLRENISDVRVQFVDTQNQTVWYPSETEE